jgi:hypothetical protein
VGECDRASSGRPWGQRQHDPSAGAADRIPVTGCTVPSVHPPIQPPQAPSSTRSTTPPEKGQLSEPGALPHPRHPVPQHAESESETESETETESESVSETESESVSETESETVTETESATEPQQRAHLAQPSEANPGARQRARAAVAARPLTQESSLASPSSHAVPLARRWAPT